MADIILRKADIDRFTGILSQLVEKARLLLSVLIHKDGHLLASSGGVKGIDITSLSALVSANFASTIAVANLIGETEFKTQLHRGSSRCIYVSLVDDDTFLVSIFNSSTSIDSVKVYTEEYQRELCRSLEVLYNPTEEPESLDLETDEFPFEKTIQISAEELGIPVQSKTSLSSGARMSVDESEVQPRVLPHTGKEAPSAETPAKKRVSSPPPPPPPAPSGRKPEPLQRPAAPSSQPPRMKTPPDRKTEIMSKSDTAMLKVNPEFLRRKAREIMLREKKRR